MKTQISIPGFIYAKIPESWGFGAPDVIDGVKYVFSVHDNLTQPYTKVAPTYMTFCMPEKFDAVAGFVAGLKEQKTKLMADHQNELTQIDRQISQLLAITNEVVL